MAALGSLISLAGILIHNYVPNWINANAEHFYYLAMAFLLAAIGASLSLFHGALISICRAWHLNEVPAMVTLIAAAAGLLSIYFGLFFFEMDVAALGLGALVRSLISVVGTGVYILIIWKKKKLPKPAIEQQTTARIIKQATPLLISTITGAILNNSKELILALLISPASSAILSITNRIFSLVAMLINPICLSLFSALASISSEAEKFLQWVKDISSFYRIISGVLFTIALSINAYFVSVWVGMDKYGGEILSVFLCTSAWLTTKCNLDIVVLNSKAIFNKTAWISIFDLVLRMLGVLVILVFGIRFEIYYLPLIECISISLAVIFLNDTINKKINNTEHNPVQISFFGYLAICIAVGILISYLISRIQFGGFGDTWISLIIVASLVALIFMGTVYLRKKNRILITKLMKI
jgi:O-antigen/teichoic acid export membrane protein